MAKDGCVNEPGWSLEFWERDAYSCCDAHALALACHHGFETFERGARAWIEMFERDGHAAACSLSGGWRLVLFLHTFYGHAAKEKSVDCKR